MIKGEQQKLKDLFFLAIGSHCAPHQVKLGPAVPNSAPRLRSEGKKTVLRGGGKGPTVRKLVEELEGVL